MQWFYVIDDIRMLSFHQLLEGISKVKFSTPLSLKYLRLLGPRLLRRLSKQRMWESPKLRLAHWDWGSRTFFWQAAECLVSGTFQGTQNQVLTGPPKMHRSAIFMKEIEWKKTASKSLVFPWFFSMCFHGDSVSPMGPNALLVGLACTGWFL